MKKIARRLVLRTEVVRALSTTSLACAAGGATTEARCAPVAIFGSGEFQCEVPQLQTAGCAK
jgi:hypothetical protein